MTQINGSLSFDTEKIGRTVAESLHDSFAALHASLAAVSARLQQPLPLTRAEATQALTGPLDTVRAASLAELLYANGFALVKLDAIAGQERTAVPTETVEERHRRWFGREQD